MKNIITLSLLIVFCGLQAVGQCHTEGSDVLCIEKITAANTYVKSYKLDAQRAGDVEYSTVLVKDLRYYLNLCEEGEVSNSIEIDVYDSNRKLVKSNKSGGQSILTELSFTCPRTGVYYFVFKKGSANPNCGIGALSFSR
jgi:hypothetical protein